MDKAAEVLQQKPVPPIKKRRDKCQDVDCILCRPVEYPTDDSISDTEWEKRLIEFLQESPVKWYILLALIVLLVGEEIGFLVCLMRLIWQDRQSAQENGFLLAPNPAMASSSAPPNVYDRVGPWNGSSDGNGRRGSDASPAASVTRRQTRSQGTSASASSLNQSRTSEYYNPLDLFGISEHADESFVQRIMYLFEQYPWTQRDFQQLRLLTERHYDAVVLCAEEDRDNAFKFVDRLRIIQLRDGENAKILCMMDSCRDVHICYSTLEQWIHEARQSCTFVILYMTEHIFKSPDYQQFQQLSRDSNKENEPKVIPMFTSRSDKKDLHSRFESSALISIEGVCLDDRHADTNIKKMFNYSLLFRKNRERKQLKKLEKKLKRGGESPSNPKD